MKEIVQIKKVILINNNNLKDEIKEIKKEMVNSQNLLLQ